MSKLKFVAWSLTHKHDTFHWIHSGYKKAFENLGFDAYHFDGNSIPSGFDFENTIFFTMGHFENDMPINDSSYYILHNSQNPKRYDSNRCIHLQVFADGAEGVFPQPDSGIVQQEGHHEKLDEFVYYDHVGRGLYMPWATNLLPHECELELLHNENKTIQWVGSYGRGDYFQNADNIDRFIDRARTFGYTFNRDGYPEQAISFEENRKLIAESGIAPSLVGDWQRNSGYIPCRLFKNISYGKLAICNSKNMHRVMEGNVVFDEDESVLFDKYNSLGLNEKKKMFRESAKLVAEKHTFVSRAKTLLYCLGLS